MKRRLLFSVLLYFSATPALLADSSLLNLNDCRVVHSIFDLWRDSGYGFRPKQVEAASWVLQTREADRYNFQRWPSSAEPDKEIWKGPVPRDVVAQVHTHPSKVDPKPSTKDAELAERLQIPVFTISDRGLWQVTPTGEVTKEAGREWLKRLAECGNSPDVPDPNY